MKDKNRVQMPIEDRAAITIMMEDHHSIFLAFWRVSTPYYTDELPTAAVEFTPDGNACNLLINKDFWDSLDDDSKAFIIAHEAMHIILDHGRRLKAKDINKTIANIAMDIAVNHSIERNLEIPRSTLKNADDYCWVDTVFSEEDDDLPPDDQNTEFYYDLLMEGASYAEKMTVDCHNVLASGEPSEAFSDAFSESISDTLLPEEAEKLNDILGSGSTEGTTAGSIAGKLEQLVKVEVKKKKKWETVIKKWAKKYTKNQDSESIEQWALDSRRLSILDSGLMLPSEADLDRPELGKINVWFFQDTSGSCAHLAKRFFKAAASLPKERFNVKLFCFDTRVYPTTLESGKLYGFGGTYFHILETYIEHQMILRETKYPEAVFVVTDGYGDPIYPSYPKRWYWFLSSRFRSYIPSGCNIFNLRDFE
jgi:hypothetical protein